MAGIDRLEQCFLPLDRRDTPESCFFRIIGRDAQGEILARLNRYYQLAQTGGASLQNGIGNPTGTETGRFYDAVGRQFAISRPLIERHMTVWLGQLRPVPRQSLSGTMLEALELLRTQGANDNSVKNTYVKFMCWLRGPFGRVLSGLGKASPPKVLLEGDVQKHELLLLSLLHRAGCDVWYVNFTSQAAYQKADPTGQFSQLIQGELLEPPVEPFPPGSPAKSRPAAPRPSAPKQSPPPPAGPAPWAGMEKEVILNDWAAGKPVWEAVLLPLSQRGSETPPKLRGLFAACFGADERGTYRNHLFHLKRALEGSGRPFVLLDQKLPAPAPAETACFLDLDKTMPRPALIRALASRLSPTCGKVQLLLVQCAFARVMEQNPEQDSVRLFNRGVRLACWLKQYMERLFSRTEAEQPPALVCYGPVTEAEISLLWALAHCGVDVLYFSPDAGVREEFSRHFLPKLWIEVLFDGSLPLEPFPQREERIRAGTTAYNASQELDQLLYSDTGMFRDRQFARSQPVTLKTTYDEVGQLWPEEAQYRPSFATKDGVVYVPNLFAKICGVDQGDLELYWDRIRGMITENTYLVTSLPFLQTDGPSMSTAQARSFLHDGRLDPKALKTSRFYRYDYLPDDTQDYILEKIQALIDYDLIVDGGPDLPAAMLSVLMNLDKDLLRLLQNFDFTRAIPKLLVVDATETLFTLEECILMAFLNLTGFDIAVFTPTGYRNLEKHLRPDSFDTLTAGEFRFDLTVPDLRRPSKGGWFGRIFGGG